jgi:glycosyltransferase involved in cell wall biosynthesis
MKIAIIAPHREYMGDTRSIPMLGKALSKLGHSVDLLEAWQEWNQVQWSSDKTGVRVVNLRTRWFAPVLPNISKISEWASYRIAAAVMFLAMIPGLIWYLYRSNPDVLIVRMLTGPTILVAKFFRPQVKILVSASGMPRHSPIRNVLWPMAYNKADGYIAAAPGVARMLSDISNVPESDISVLWEAVVDDRMLELAELVPDHKWFSAGTVPVVMGLGRLTRQKDFRTLIRAFAKVRQSISARLVIFGEGEDRSALEKEISRLHLQDDVDLPGFVTNPYSHFRNCKVFVLSSIWESSNHSLIEAQGVGVPSITTDCPSGQEEIAMDGETALVVPVGDVSVMAEAIERLLTDRNEAARIVTNAVKHSVRFRPEYVAKEWEAKIYSLMERIE